jgi:hypothetical protein
MGNLFSSEEELEYVGNEKNHLGQKVSIFKNSNGSTIKKVGGTTLKFDDYESVKIKHKDYLEKKVADEERIAANTKKLFDEMSKKIIGGSGLSDTKKILLSAGSTTTSKLLFSKPVRHTLMGKPDDPHYLVQANNMMFVDGVSKFKDVSFSTFDTMCQFHTDPYY